MFKKIFVMAAASQSVLAKHLFMDIEHDVENDMYFVKGVLGT